MEDKGYAFTPIALLLFIPVIIIGISFSGIVNEVNSISSIVIGGDVTATVASNVVKAIKDDAQDAGRHSAFCATESVFDNYNKSISINPFFGGPSTPIDSRTYIQNATLTFVNSNLTNTCRELELQTGRNITINNNPIDPQATNSVTIFTPSNMQITQSDPFGFNISLDSIPVNITQNSTTNNQSSNFNTPKINVYISVEQLEDPYIWVNTIGRNNSVIFKYPYYTQSSSIIGGNASTIYHFADQVSAGKLNYLNESLAGSNQSFGNIPYYFPDTHGLTFFDRLENRTNATSLGPDSAKMSTFILWNPNYQNMPGYKPSYLDHEYFAGINGTPITTTHAGVVTNVTDPLGNTFYLSSTYKTILGLLDNYNF